MRLSVVEPLESGRIWFAKTLREAEQRQNSLPKMAAVMMLLFWLAIAALAWDVKRKIDPMSQQELDIAVRALFALVLLFGILVWCRQYMAKQVRGLAAQQQLADLLQSSDAPKHTYVLFQRCVVPPR
jgi:hypothetical protein